MRLVADVLRPFRTLYKVLPHQSRQGLVLVVVVSLIAAVFETISVASILPFMAIVMDPSSISKYSWLKQTLSMFGVSSPQGEIVAAGLITIVVLAMGNAVSATNLWVQTRYLTFARRELSTELFAGYLSQPYSFHVQRDISSLTRVIGGDVESALGGFLASLLSVVSKGLSGLVLIGLIVAVDPLVAFGAIVVLGGAYMLVFRMIRVRQTALGARMVSASEILERARLEGLAGIKELRVLGRETSSINMFRDANTELTRTHASNVLATAMPRYVIEVFAYAGIVAVTLVLVLKGEAIAAIPSLALYALAGNRLAPTFQQLFAAAITIKYHTRAVQNLQADLAIIRRGETISDEDNSEPLIFNHEIKLTDLTFTYQSANRPALSHVSLVIKRNQSIGLVGRTGSGKTTLADVILGLYPPESGVISIDGIELTTQNERAWRKRVGYVPQHVFLTNASIARNIALGVPDEEIDWEAVEKAAQMAQAEEFIKHLPESFDTVVGERGVRLSGGQRQRLGIARALYHNPDVLVFDEATSALDGMTEDAVMQAMERLSSDRTMILIAHRLRTVQACDRIVMLDTGTVVADGKYEELLESSLPFKQLAGQMNYGESEQISV